MQTWLIQLETRVQRQAFANTTFEKGAEFIG
jgi:hypothetical protein